ncbi:MAG: membrane protein insertion efficiency factor YidD [bacterium]|nr:membrane protein insertion efficiency factor YidD [bacterium]
MPALRSAAVRIALAFLASASAALCTPPGIARADGAGVDHPAAELRARPPEHPPRELERVLTFVFGFYRTCISPLDGAKCGYTPSCSRFGQDAIGRHGLQGLLMTSDRLQRCHGCSGSFYVHHPGSGLSLDPVADNRLWGSQHATYDEPRAGSTTTRGRSLSVPDQAQAPTAVGDSLFPSSHESYYGEKAIKRFADHLAGRGDHFRAAGEYERLLSILPQQDPRGIGVRYQIARNLLCSGNAEMAASYLEPLFARGLPDAWTPKVRRGLALCDLIRGRHAEARRRFDTGRVRADLADSSAAISLSRDEGEIIAASLLLEKRWREADATLMSTMDATGPPLSPVAATLRELAAAGMCGSRKSETLAGVLSTLAPGAGKIYAGRTADGLFSFVSIAFCTWQAVDGFDRSGSGSAKGWVFGGLATGLYAGNIYGSILSARIHNREFELELTARARTVIAGWSCDF